MLSLLDQLSHVMHPMLQLSQDLQELSTQPYMYNKRLTPMYLLRNPVSRLKNTYSLPMKCPYLSNRLNHMRQGLQVFIFECD